MKHPRVVCPTAGGGIGDDLYDGSAAFGRFMSWIGLIIGSIVGIGLIVLGVYLVVTKERHSKSVSATITTADCNTASESSCTKNGSDEVCETRPVTNCNLTVRYLVDQEQYTSKMAVRDYTTTHLQPGETYKLWYNENEPKDVSRDESTRKVVGWILLGFGSVILFIAIVSFYVTQRFKFAAAATGVGSIVSVFN